MSPARTGRGRQAKGRSFERSIIQRLWIAVGKEPPWKKHARPDDGYVPPPPFNQWKIECKKQEALNIWAALKQAREDAGPGGLPAVVFTRAREDMWVAIPLKEWERLVLVYGRPGVEAQIFRDGTAMFRSDE